MADPCLQPTLFPERPAEFAAAEVPLADLPPDEAILGGAPPAALVASVRRDGVLQPVLLVRADPGGYWIAEGRRRIKAARAAGCAAIPAWVADGDRAFAAALGLVTHAARRDNPAAELDAIERLLALGADERQIARETGLRLATIRRRRRLGSLHAGLREALRRGALAVGAAERAATLPEAAQARLVARLDDGERLTTATVTAERRARREAAAVALPLAALAATPAAADLARPATPTPEQLLALVADALRPHLGDAVAVERDEMELRLGFPDGAVFAVAVRPLASAASAAA